MEGGVCAACLGLHFLADHNSSSCPLLKAALARCDCEGPPCDWIAPLCERQLFSILLSLQIFDGMVCLTGLEEDLSVGVIVERLGLSRRFWGSSVPSQAFGLYVRLTDEDKVKKMRLQTRLVPCPTRWNQIESPIALELDLWSADCDGRVVVLSKPFPREMCCLCCCFSHNQFFSQLCRPQSAFCLLLVGDRFWWTCCRAQLVV